MIPKVSVIVPIYNVEKYLDQCVQALLAQTLSDIEIILIDDGSPDNCPKICDDYAAQYPNIKVIHKKNAGLGMACNSGLDVATGEYVAFCDSDDYVDSDMYMTMYNVAQKYTCDAVFTGLKRITMAGIPAGTVTHQKEFKLYKNENEIHTLLKDLIASDPYAREERAIQVSAKVVLYRRNLIEKKHLRFVSERILPSEDLIFNVDVLANSNIVCVLPQTFYNYRTNPISISHTVKKEKFNLFKQLYIEITDRYHRLGVEDNVQLRIQRMFLGYTRSYICNILNSNITNIEKKQITSSICKDAIWKPIWKTYPLSVMPLPHRIFTFAMRHNFYSLLLVLAKIKK